MLLLAPGRAFDQERLAETIGEPLTDEARNGVQCTARRKADDHVHRPRRIIQRRGDLWKNRNRRGGPGEP
jgi:hypothetical protein